MERIPLERAIRFIKADFDVNQQPCFFFVVGAGISKPPIPLASEIIDLLRKEVNDESIVEPDAKAPLFHRYSWWFRQAFASPDATRPFLERIIDRKSTRLNSSHRCISYAVFCLENTPVLQAPMYLACTLFVYSVSINALTSP